jgi:predicted metalloprotease with PDZ domain
MYSFLALTKARRIIVVLTSFCLLSDHPVWAQQENPLIEYTVTAPQVAVHRLHVELQMSGRQQDTLKFKIPKWTPGYYQLLNYANAIENLVAKDSRDGILPIKKSNDNTWIMGGIKNKKIKLSYDVKAEKQFVAQSFVDSSRAYIVPASVFLYPEGYLQTPATIKVDLNKNWKIATGLENVQSKTNEFIAPNFDILYDCPILAGELEELPSFYIGGIEHRFIGYKLGNFDRMAFMRSLKKIVEASVAIIGDIPYKKYTFIAIGPGRGGIEHLNNTTVSFNGDDLHSPEPINRMMNFLAHEYFHHYNVKRIRPFELGPFDYDQGSRTNLLWVSEGLSVYYEYLVVKRAGLADERTLYSNLENNVNATENNPGRVYQSLTQASYRTWSDGPFGTQGDDVGKTISYYDKGPVVGLLLDLAIRHATQNRKSLDDVMRLLYWQYYKKMNRGFTDAEFEQTCESIAGTRLTNLFEYVYTTKELDYNTYLDYAGLRMESKENADAKGKSFTIHRLEKSDVLQQAILKSWLGE